MLRQRKCFQAREVGGIQNRRSAERAGAAELKEGLRSLRPQILTGKGKETVLIATSVRCNHLQDEL